MKEKHIFFFLKKTPPKLDKLGSHKIYTYFVQ